MRVWKVLYDDINMDIALLIDDLSMYKGKKINDYEWQWGNSKNGIAQAHEKCKRILDKSEFTHVYFGNEFCEYRIPTLSEIERGIKLASDESLEFVLVTPVVTDYGIQKLSDIFEYFNRKSINVDVVVNDFGVLSLLSEKCKDINVIIGRVMDKTSHDKRVSVKRLNAYYGALGLKYAGTPGIISIYANNALKKYNIKRYEFDNSGISMELDECREKSIYWPYSYLTTGRVCSTRSYSKKGNEKYMVGNGVCSRQCRKLQIEKHKPLNEHADGKSDLFLFERGNTLFFISESDIELTQFNRIILQL